jgi:branched-chain amino acid transport system substrate-binding protein
VPTAPLMPMMKQREKLLMGNFSFQVNHKVNHEMWFNNSPWNDARSWSEGFFELGQSQGAKSIAFLAADQEFAQNLANGARDFAKKLGLSTVYEQNYPPTTVDFSAMIRAVRSTRPDMVFVMSYPNDSAAIVRSVKELGVGPSVKLFGGGMVGLQFTPIMTALGSALNGIVNYNTYVPGMDYPGIAEFFKNYSKRAIDAKVDPLGFYLPPFNYAIGQIYEQAVGATKSLDHKTLAGWLRTNEVKTVVGPIRWDKSGEWANPRVIMNQFQGVKDGDLEQFKKPGTQVILYPKNLSNGQLKAPFEQARA